MEDPRVWVEKQETIKNGGQPKSHQQYEKRRRPGRLLVIIKVNGNQPDGEMLHVYGQKRNVAKRAVDKARSDMEADMYTKVN